MKPWPSQNPTSSFAATLKRRGSDAGRCKAIGAGHEDEAKELLKIAAGFQEAEDKLNGYAKEVKAGRILRNGAEA